jgi:magnesium-transporting ATPase (P-type)
METVPFLTRKLPPVEVLSVDLVPGDIVLLEAGSIVPADGRVTESASLRIQEAVLTGESDAVEKRTDKLPGTGALGPGDQVNMAFIVAANIHAPNRYQTSAGSSVFSCGVKRRAIPAKSIPQNAIASIVAQLTPAKVKLPKRSVRA